MAAATAANVDRFWTLVRHTVAMLTSNAKLSPTKLVVGIDVAASAVVGSFKRATELRRQRCHCCHAGRKPKCPLPLRVHSSDPRHLARIDAFLGAQDQDAVVRFFDTTATAAEWRLVMNMGGGNLLLQFPKLASRSSTLLAATVDYITRDNVVRSRTRELANSMSSEKRQLAHILLKVLAADHRDNHNTFTPEVLGAALKSLTRTSSKPRHLVNAYKLLLIAPATAVAMHAQVGRVAASVPRLRSVAIITLAERLTRVISHPDALDMMLEANVAMCG